MFFRRLFLLLAFVFAAGLFTSCESLDAPSGQSRAGMLADIKAEPPGDYFIGRRYYKVDYKFWGFIRKPGESWGKARLVMMNEQQKLAPDRELGKIGSDNNYEYKLFGRFSGDTVYEPASNGFYPEFVLTGYEIKSVSPGNIYKTPGATDPRRRIIPTTY